MSSTEYVCIEIVEDTSGVYDCKKWVAQPNYDTVLTKEQIQELGGILVWFFAAIACYMIVVKAIKIA